MAARRIERAAAPAALAAPAAGVGWDELRLRPPTALNLDHPQRRIAVDGRSADGQRARPRVPPRPCKLVRFGQALPMKSKQLNSLAQAFSMPSHTQWLTR